MTGLGQPPNFADIPVDDRGRRASDVVTTHMLADPEGAPGRWVALYLSNGGSDGVLYDTRTDAIDHQLIESQCYYLRIPRDGLGPNAATRLLQLAEQTYDGGFRFSDPPGEQEMIVPDRLGFRSTL